jgi:CheY-like chemotaxis protein
MSRPSVLVIDDSPTILKVVQLVLTKAGFDVHTAQDGEAGVSAARELGPDLVLLDFVMPKMNGYQVCRALAAEDGLKDIPVVLMSAKGDQVGERFVKVMGIVDYITKPFSPEAITAVVQHSVNKYSEREIGEFTRPLIPPNIQTETEENAAEPVSYENLRGGLADAVAARIAGLFSLAEAASSEGDEDAVPTDAGAIAQAARAALDDETLGQLLREHAPDAGASGGPALRGDLHVVPIAEVLQLLDAQKQTGTLRLERGDGSVEVHFRGGRVELALAEGVADEFLLGRFIVDQELLSRQDFEGFLESRPPGSKLIGNQLVKLGYLSEAELKGALGKQTAELIYEALRWSFGSFAFHRDRELPAIALDASLGLDVEGILMEGFRRVDEWHLIEREVDDFDMVFLRNEDAVAQMGRGRLTREELAVLELVNGKNTVKEIVRSSRMGSFEVSKMLYRLLSIKLIRRRVMPVAV